MQSSNPVLSKAEWGQPGQVQYAPGQPFPGQPAPGQQFPGQYPPGYDPYAQQQYGQPPVQQAPTLPETGIDRILAGRRVLIVEDEPDNQELMRTVIQDLLGGEAVVSSDGERAVFEAVERPPALILLDLMLPSLSGWEVARRLRQSLE